MNHLKPLSSKFLALFLICLTFGMADITWAQNRPRTTTPPRRGTTTTRPATPVRPRAATPARPATTTPSKPATPATPAVARPDTSSASGVFAEITTQKGKMLCKLYYEQVPLTVANFVGLIEGTKNSIKPLGTPFYDGLKWHRVVKDFVIQGGDPNGDGSGGPGYSFADEFDPNLKHDGVGILSMANSGPATNGSQFFITHKATPWLDGKHSVFGRVIKGIDVVNAVEQDDDIQSIKIIRKGPKAQLFVIDQAKFEAIQTQAKVAEEAYKVKEAALMEEKMRTTEVRIKQMYPNAIKTPTGIYYTITQVGTGPKAVKNAEVKFHSVGKILDGQTLDDTRSRNQPASITIGQRPILKGIEDMFYDMKQGERRVMVLPYTMCYVGDPKALVFPAGTFIVFDVEFLEVKVPQN
jgi:peptidylprolyl isomerase